MLAVFSFLLSSSVLVSSAQVVSTQKLLYTNNKWELWVLISPMGFSSSYQEAVSWALSLVGQGISFQNELQVICLWMAYHCRMLTDIILQSKHRI